MFGAPPSFPSDSGNDVMSYASNILEVINCTIYRLELNNYADIFSNIGRHFCYREC